MIARAGAKPETREAPSQSCWAVTPETLAAAPSGGLAPEELREIIDQAIHEEAMDAGRVKLNAGEAVCIDNYRCLHAREAFWGERERRLWRIWTWTSSGDVRAPSHRFVNTCSTAVLCCAKSTTAEVDWPTLFCRVCFLKVNLTCLVARRR